MSELPEAALSVFHGLRANAYMIQRCRVIAERVAKHGPPKDQRAKPVTKLPSLDPGIEAANRIAARDVFAGIEPAPFVVLRVRRLAERIEMTRKSYESRYAWANELWRQGYTLKEISRRIGELRHTLFALIFKMRTRYGMFPKRPRYGYKQPPGLP